MAGLRNKLNDADCQDAHGVVIDAATDFGLILRFEVRPGKDRSYVHCLAFRQGAVDRSKTIYQSKHEFSSTAAKDIGSVLYHTALDVYLQADRARVRAEFDATVGLAPVSSLPL